MKLSELKGKKILIVGYGIEGKSVEAFLKHHFPSQQIDVTDESEGNDYLNKQSKYDLVIKSPGVHKSLITIPYTTATNIFFANVKGITIGITGSKGKSTTTSLIYAVLKEAGEKAHLVGNITHKLDAIGYPMLTKLLETNSPDDYWVCELSSYQLDDIEYSPHISVMTSFFPEHLNYHKTMENYWAAKSRIVKHAKPNDYFVYNQQHPKIAELATQTAAQPIPFLDGLPFPENTIPLLGPHNFANVRAACAVGQVLGISDDIISRAVKNFTPLPHRLEKVGTFQEITFYDDAISTTPESTILAIDTLKNVCTIFLGGQDRGYDFSKLAKKIVEYKIENLVLFPESGSKIFEEIRKISRKGFTILRTTNMKEAVNFAYEHTPKGTICLLSTASPSYTVWKNFEEKGNLFKKYVREQAEQ